MTTHPEPRYKTGSKQFFTLFFVMITFDVNVNSSMVDRVVVSANEHLVTLTYNNGREYRYLTDSPISVAHTIIRENNRPGGSVGKLLHSMFADNTLIPENQLIP